LILTRREEETGKYEECNEKEGGFHKLKFRKYLSKFNKYY
jgi:hypothetical protein